MVHSLVKKILLIPVIIFSIYSSVAIAEDAAPTPVPPPPPPKDPWAGLYETITISDKHRRHPKYELAVELPNFYGRYIKHSETLNALAKDIAMDEVRRFKLYADTVLVQTPPAYLPGESFLNVGFNLSLVTREFVSFIMTFNKYVAGQKEPKVWTRTINFDGRTGRSVYLNDLFPGATRYLTIISMMAQSKLRHLIDHGSTEEWIEKGAGPDDDNFDRFQITPAGLLIIFDPNQVAPFSMGKQEIILGFDEIAPLIKKESPILRIMGR